MRIGEMARALGTDPPTIRYYEEVGILPAAERSENRYREYGDEDVRRIELVLALRRLDVPLGEIRTLAGTCFEHRCATGTQQLLAVIDRRSGTSAQADRGATRPGRSLCRPATTAEQ